MENASKALIMAAGILVGILILTLMVVLFSNTSNLSKEYDEIKYQEAVERFNANFLKYVGKDLTIHDVVTICRFADKNDVQVVNIKRTSVSDISGDVHAYTSAITSIQYYQLVESSFEFEDGYISKIEIKEKGP